MKNVNFQADWYILQVSISIWVLFGFLEVLLFIKESQTTNIVNIHNENLNKITNLLFL